MKLPNAIARDRAQAGTLSDIFTAKAKTDEISRRGSGARRNRDAPTPN